MKNESLKYISTEKDKKQNKMEIRVVGICA
jgi:hypothetical protein